jgi:hypothetical protein
MPYKNLVRKNKPCLKNVKTDKVRCFGSEQKKDNWLRVSRAVKHGFKPQKNYKKRGLAQASSETRQRVASKGGRMRRR